MNTTETLRDKIARERAGRSYRYSQFAEWWREAHAAGVAAGNAVTPTPMIVRDTVRGITYEPIADGVCGFAWVVLHPATSSFARWAAKVHQCRKEYGGGLCLVRVHQFNQSMTRKEAYAQAFAKVLQSHGLQAYSHSRMD